MTVRKTVPTPHDSWVCQKRDIEEWINEGGNEFSDKEIVTTIHKKNLDAKTYNSSDEESTAPCISHPDSLAVLEVALQYLEQQPKTNYLHNSLCRCVILI